MSERSLAVGGASAEDPGLDTHPQVAGESIRLDGLVPLTVVLVRHGVTAMTETGGYSGSDLPGPSLSTRGRTQAAQAADAVYRVGRRLWPDVPRVSAVVASPTVRTQETAAAVGRRLGLPVETDERFAECRFGEWEGLTRHQILAGWEERFRAWHLGEAAAPGGESYADVGVRVAAGLADQVAAGVGRTVAVAGHTVQIRAAVGLATGAPTSHWGRLRVPPGSLTVLRLWQDGTAEVTAAGFPTDA